MTWSAALPPHHHSWLGLVLDREIVGESRSTCHDCVMCESGTRPREEIAPLVALPGSEGPFFGEQTKCCTYLPEVANFLVGGALAEPDGPGRRTLVARIEAADAVTPLGLGKTERFKAVYGAETFGREPSLRCPHYLADDGGKCGIWLHRNAICATWFCHFDRGSAGKRFWAATSKYFKTLEEGLAHWCVEQLDPGGAPDAWGGWHGREQEFYRACADKVAGLSADQQLAICGPQAQVAARLVRDAFADRVSLEPPDPLIPGEFTVKAIAGGMARVETYTPLDPVELPSALIEALAAFDGRRTNAEAIAEIRRSHDLALSPDALQGLVDFGLLQRARTARQEVADALAAIRAKLGGAS